MRARRSTPTKVANSDQPSETNKLIAKYIAKAVRDALEDFHVAYLTDSQMKELNPTIRNAICTALHAFDHYETSSAARAFVDSTFRTIPSYWEEPQLLESYLEAETHLADPDPQL